MTSRVAASNAYRKGDKTIYENGVVTACKPCAEHPETPPLWRVKASRIIQDKTDQNVYYENAQFEFYGIPVAWVPYFYTPDPAVKQRSGSAAVIQRGLHARLHRHHTVLLGDISQLRPDAHPHIHHQRRLPYAGRLAPAPVERRL